MLHFCYVILFIFFVQGKASILIFDGDETIDEFVDSELPFAQPLEKSGIEGPILLADPLDACTEISPPPETDCSRKWIVLIAGNFCSYDTKVMNSQIAGYSAAVIYHFRGREDPIIHHQGFYSNISAVTIRTSSGIIIRDNYLYTIDDAFRILLISSHLYPYQLLLTSKYLLLLTTVAFLVIFFAVPLGIVRYVQRSRSTQESRLSTRHLRQLPVSTFQKGDPYETCAICLEDYKSKERLRILPCSHGYHAKCIDPWLTKNKRICPICKKSVVVAGEIPENNGESDAESRAETAPLLQNIDRPVSFTNYQAMTNNATLSPLNVQSGSIARTETDRISANRRENS